MLLLCWRKVHTVAILLETLKKAQKSAVWGNAWKVAGVLEKSTDGCCFFSIKAAHCTCSVQRMNGFVFGGFFCGCALLAVKLTALT